MIKNIRPVYDRCSEEEQARSNRARAFLRNPELADKIRENTLLIFHLEGDIEDANWEIDDIKFQRKVKAA